MARKSIPLPLKEAIWEDYFGDCLKGCCSVCEKKISLSSAEFGHVISVKDGGENTADNLRPICRSCNRSMGSKNMDKFIEEYFSKKDKKALKKKKPAKKRAAPKKKNDEFSTGWGVDLPKVTIPGVRW